jgi:diguanylate cyclase (GGDEF)-like protein/PAS domain S-box-containing protein
MSNQRVGASIDRKAAAGTPSAETGEAEAVLRATLDGIAQGVAAFDRDRRLQAWNARFLAMLELPPDSGAVGQSLAEVLRPGAERGDLGPGDPEELLARLMQRLQMPLGVANLYFTPSGRAIEQSTGPLPDNGFVLTLTDVTDRRSAEARLIESEERYALAARGANDGLWDWDLLSNRIYLSPRWKRILGADEDDIGEESGEWLSRIHPDDRDLVTTQLENHLAGRVPHFETEHRLKHADGSYVWVVARGLAVRDSMNRAYRIAGSMTDITLRKRTEAEALHDALHDRLTALPNRALFLDRLAQAMARSSRQGLPSYAVLCLDLDRFKLINDSMGHRRGDELLLAVARRLQGGLVPGTTIARLGGDEFAVLLEGAPGLVEVRALAESLLSHLTEPLELGGQDLVVTGSIGIAHSAHGYERAEDMMRDAELAMYRAKSLGKARAELFHPTLHHHAVQQMALETDMRSAVERGQFGIYYQPIVALDSGRIRGFEALIRWQHPERGMLSPGEFIPLAEETGLIVKIGTWALAEACARMRDWQNRFRAEIPLMVSVNLSIRQFNQIDLVGEIVDTLARSGWRAENLKLELTETALMHNSKRTAIILGQLRNQGIKLSLDDFGTGYSSLSYLHTFPIDTLKIDRSFIADMGRDRGKLEIVRSIVLLAHNLRMDVVAEGVETAEQLAQLRALNCEYAQGYFFARPLTQEQAEAMLAEEKRW